MELLYKFNNVIYTLLMTCQLREFSNTSSPTVEYSAFPNFQLRTQQLITYALGSN